MSASRLSLTHSLKGCLFTTGVRVRDTSLPRVPDPPFLVLARKHRICRESKAPYSSLEESG